MTSAGETERHPDAEPPARPEEIGDLVLRLSSEEELSRADRRRLVTRLARALGTSARKAGMAGRHRGRWLADVLVDDIIPRLGVRDLSTLREHYHGLTGEPLADALVASAIRLTAGVGAAGGALAAVEFVAPPLLLTAPFQIAAETLVVAAVEVKLIAELHAVYGVQVPGSTVQRGARFGAAWANRRGIDPRNAGSLTIAMGTGARRLLQRRLMRTLGRQLTTLGPLLTGAIAGGTLNATATRTLAGLVRADLRRIPGDR